MKVLVLAPERKRPDQLTAHSFIDEEVVALARRGIEPFVLSPTVEREQRDCGVTLVPVPGGGLADECARALRFGVRHARHIPLRMLTSPGYLHYVARIERHASILIRERGIQLIHSHFGSPGGLGGMLARAETGVPLVASLRGMDLLLDRSIGYGLRSDPGFDRSVRRLLAGADRTWYNSRFMLERGISLGARPERTAILRKGVDLARFRADDDAAGLRANLGIDGPMVLTVAGLIRRKGIDHIIRALARVGGEVRPTLVVCGKGPDRERLERIAREEGVAERVRFEGQVGRAEIAKYFGACDVFVLASLHEAAGNVLLEAMASGRPVVCTDSGGPPEYVEHGETGFVVPPGDVSALSGALQTVLEDSALAARLGREGRLRAEREYPYSRMIDDMVTMYREVIADPDSIAVTNPNHPPP